MRIVILGANSYIARNVFYTLLHEYDEVEVELFDIADRHIDGAKNYKQINILDAESLKTIDLRCDVIFMFVGKTGSLDGFYDYNTFIDINEKALLNLIKEYVIQNSRAKIIFPSTRLVYKGNECLLQEDSEKEFKTIYAINKYACEQYLKQYNVMSDLQYCILRICVPYGTMIEGASSYGTAEFMLNRAKLGEDISLYGDGSMRRTIIHMQDLCNIIIRAAFSDKCVNDIFNIGGENYSLNEMAIMIANKYNVEVKYVPWPEEQYKIESGSTVFDDSKIKKIIQYQYKKKFVEWIRENA